MDARLPTEPIIGLTSLMLQGGREPEQLDDFRHFFGEFFEDADAAELLVT